MARKRGVTLEQVLSASERLADGTGLDGVTLAAVARSLGIRSPSLYSHIGGLDDLLRLMALSAADQMAAEFRDAVGAMEGVGALRTIAYRYRDFARRHPGRYEAVQRAVRPGKDEELYAALGAVVVPVSEALAQTGIPPEERIHMARTLRSALHGFVELERIGGFGLPESIDDSFHRMVELMLSGLRTRGRRGPEGTH